MSLVFDPAITERARAALLSQYARKPRIRAFVDALAAGAKEHERTAFDLVYGTTFTIAQGANLDQWGAIVGEERGGLADNEYRRFIRSRIVANYCAGSRDEVIRVFALSTDAREVRHVDRPPHGFTLYALREQLMSDLAKRRVRRLLEDVKPGGVSLKLVEVPAGYFGFAGDGPFPSGLFDPLAFNVGTLARLI